MRQYICTVFESVLIMYHYYSRWVFIEIWSVSAVGKDNGYICRYCRVWGGLAYSGDKLLICSSSGVRIQECSKRRFLNDVRASRTVDNTASFAPVKAISWYCLGDAGILLWAVSLVSQIVGSVKSVYRGTTGSAHHQSIIHHVVQKWDHTKIGEVYLGNTITALQNVSFKLGLTVTCYSSYLSPSRTKSTHHWIMSFSRTYGLFIFAHSMSLTLRPIQKGRCWLQYILDHCFTEASQAHQLWYTLHSCDS